MSKRQAYFYWEDWAREPVWVRVREQILGPVAARAREEGLFHVDLMGPFLERISALVHAQAREALR